MPFVTGFKKNASRALNSNSNYLQINGSIYSYEEKIILIHVNAIYNRGEFFIRSATTPTNLLLYPYVHQPPLGKRGRTTQNERNRLEGAFVRCIISRGETQMCALYAAPQRPTSSTADAAHPRTSELGWWWWLLSGGEQKSAQKTPSLAWNYKVPVYVISVLELLLSTGRNRAASAQSRSFNIHRIFFRIAKFSNLQKFISCKSSNTFFVKRNVKNVRASRDLNEDDMCLLCGVYVPKGFSSVREKRGKGEAASNLGQCRWFIPDDSRLCHVWCSNGGQRG